MAYQSYCQAVSQLAFLSRYCIRQILLHTPRKLEFPVALAPDKILATLLAMYH